MRDYLDYIAYLTEPTLEMRLWCFFLVLVILLFSWRKNFLYRPTYPLAQLEGPRTIFLFIGFLLLALTYWIDEDYFSYIELAQIQNIDWQFDNEAYLEKGHQLLCFVAHGNWFYYRLLCWSISLLLFVLTAKRLRINVQHALFCLFILWYHTFCYGRVTLAMAFYFYGVSFLCKPITKYLIRSYIIGIIIILSSFYFHRSIILLIVITPAIYMLQVKKQTSIIYSLICIALVFSIVIINITILYTSNSIEEETANKLATYSVRELQDKSIIGYIVLYITYIAKYIPILVSTYFVILKKMPLPNYIKMFFSVMIITFTISIAFYFSGKAQYTLFYRTLNFTMIPSSLIIAFLHQEGIMSQRIFFWTLLGGMCIGFLKVFYPIYSY